jgi:hypothetical protein
METKLTPMNPKVKARWLRALRSGKFKQCRGVLRQGDTFCCLGVLMELAKRSKVIQDYIHTHGTLSSEVVVWAGLKNRDPLISPSGSATKYNDGIGDELPRSFEEIADLIEKNL